MSTRTRGFVAALVLAAVSAAPAHAAPTVSIRIEGEQRTLVPRTTVELQPGQIEGVNDECDGTTIAGAIDRATNGNWDHDTYTRVIMGERHDFSRNDAWSGWQMNTGKLTGGFCQTTLQEGDDIVVMANFAGGEAEQYRWRHRPLALRDVPAQVERGQAFTVRVEEVEPDRDAFGFEQANSGRWIPEDGVSVSGGGVSGTTDADGRVELRIGEAGDFALQAASGPGLDRSHPVPIRVVEPGVDAPPPPAPPAPPCLTSGNDGRCGTTDTEPPFAFITSIDERDVFPRRRGPRELSGTAGVLRAGGIQPDGTGILMVKLRLTRRVGARCSTWSPTRERFVPRPCGAANGFWFKVGEQPAWEYLLPARLRRGRYVLDADAIDRNGNRARVRRRGENRVVFRVR